MPATFLAAAETETGASGGFRWFRECATVRFAGRAECLGVFSSGPKGEVIGTAAPPLSGFIRANCPNLSQSRSVHGLDAMQICTLES